MSKQCGQSLVATYGQTDHYLPVFNQMINFGYKGVMIHGKDEKDAEIMPFNIFKDGDINMISQPHQKCLW